MIPLPGPQNPMPYLRRHRAEEVVDLLVGVDGDAEVDVGADLGLDEVVAVHGRRHGDLGQAGGHELQQRHLRRGVLHRHAIGVEVGVAGAPLELLARGSPRWLTRIFSVSVSGRPRRSAAELRPFGERGVDPLDELDRACWR